MKKKILIFCIYLAGVIGLIAFVAVRFNTLPAPLLNSNLDNFGELYLMNYVNDFRIPISNPEDRAVYAQARQKVMDEVPVQDAEIITFGDSFFNWIHLYPFPQRIADETNRPVRHFQTYYAEEHLTNIDYDTTQARVVVYEVVERYIPLLFSKKYRANLAQQHEIKNRKLDYIFVKEPEKKYSVLLQKSWLSHHIYSFIATIKFKLFDELPATTPVYSEEPPMLFYSELFNGRATSYNFDFSEEDIYEMCDGIEALAKTLEEDFNMKFVFLPLPNPVSVHYDLIGRDDYNQLISRIGTELDNRNIVNVKVYEPFMQSGEILYFPNDTHWNHKAIDITAKEVKSVIDNLN